MFSGVPAFAEDPFSAQGLKDPKIKVPGISDFSTIEKAPAAARNGRNVHCAVLLKEGGEPVQMGISWHIFSTIPGQDGKLRLIAAAEGGSHNFGLAPGDYFLSAAFGRATATKRLRIPASGDIKDQVLVMDAGGLILRAVSGNDTKIPPKELKFSVYTNDVQEDGERGLVAKDVAPDTVLRLNSGTYHIVSTYGSVNAVIRADIQVAAGKLTEATIQHRAARVTVTLVSAPGGEAIADTAWSILANSGDIIAENVGAFSSMVLAEGSYTAVARNKDQIYQRDFEVKAGKNMQVEVLLDRDAAQPQSQGAGAESTAD